MVAHAEAFGRERYRAAMTAELSAAWAAHGAVR
jgi:hypothetical protein